MDVQALTVADITTVAGATVVIAILAAAIFKFAAFTDAAKARYGPLLTLVIGIVIVGLATWALGPVGRFDAVQAALTGILAGSAALGATQVISSAGAKG